MVKYTINHTNKAAKKIIPGLGGQTNNYIKKASCLRKILLFLANKLTKIENSSEMKSYEKNELKKIRQDLLKLSLYDKKKKIDFYLVCLSIISNY
jgi:hypothetical protein